MEIATIKSFEQLTNTLQDHPDSYVLIHKTGSATSDCALNHIEDAKTGNDQIHVFMVDVQETKDIHGHYHVTSVPSLLEFENREFKNVIKGCHDSTYYKALFENAIFKAEVKSGKKKYKDVTVYSTPTCSWCNTLKSYLRKNRIPFRDIDVSKDEKAAQELVRRSGQQGVPQTEIEGQMIVGFDQKKIDRLLEIS